MCCQKIVNEVEEEKVRFLGMLPSTLSANLLADMICKATMLE